MASNKFLYRKVISITLNFLLGNKILRKLTAKIVDVLVYEKMVEFNDIYTENIRYEKYVILSNLFRTIEKALNNKNISSPVRKKIIDVFVGCVLLKSKKKNHTNFIKEFAENPPGFITISPGKKCNLECSYCYAGKGIAASEKLDYKTVDRIINEKTELWNSYFTVVSGGEPLLWKSDNKGIIDLCRDHPDNYFMIYTNGTLITKEVAKQMADVGNISPSISIEGFEPETDERRGKGTYKKIMEAMANLREAGVPFGISVTAMRNNAELITSDKFIDFYFEKQGALYGWIFQYMHIGKQYNLNLMVTPEQRKIMFEREKQIIHHKHIFLPDFWNGGVYSNGCLAGGRPGGYIYIEWNGNVTPCVFYPFSKVNIKDIYENGGSLNDTLKSDLMAGIRKWQRDYGFQKSGKEVCNLIAPCEIRDHYEFTKELLEKTNALPIDADAAEAIKNPLYYKGLVEYDNKFMILCEEIWKNEFMEDRTKDDKTKIIVEM